MLLATAQDLSPLLLLSDLADHTKNLAADPRASLLVDGTAGLDEPLTGARVSLVGSVAQAPEGEADAARARYLARHPSAEGYAGFGDFNFYRFTIQAAHLVAGFGRIHWLDAAELAPPAAPELAAREADIVVHMNTDHADAVGLYATKLLGLPVGDWRLIGIDAEGCDLRADGRVARLGFGERILDADQARAELVRLVKQARAVA